MIQKSIFWLFLLLALVQWAIPGNMIMEQETILKEGKAYNFETRPIDPADPFRGRYITLDFKENQFKMFKDSTWEEIHNDQPIFVELGTDSAGFVKILNVHKTEPNADYLKVKDWYTWTDGNDTTRINLHYPFNRFYLEESKAPKAEEVYREARRDPSQQAWAVVKILNGQAVLEEVMLNGKPIIESI